MIKVALTCATILIAFAGVGPASAAQGQCLSCCGGLNGNGYCLSWCTSSCTGSGGHKQIMRTTTQCDAQHRTLVCSGPRCTIMCSSNSSSTY
jgi:hypothetical protein